MAQWIYRALGDKNLKRFQTPVLWPDIVLVPSKPRSCIFFNFDGFRLKKMVKVTSNCLSIIVSLACIMPKNVQQACFDLANEHTLTTLLLMLYQCIHQLVINSANFPLSYQEACALESY